MTISADEPTATDDREGTAPLIPTMTLDLDWRWRRPGPRPRLPKGEPRDDARPIRCMVGGEERSAPAEALPYPDGSVGHVEAGTVFAYVRNDDGLAGEIARMLRPGGTVTLRVPATGPLAGLDGYNVSRYVVDITGRGPRAFEVAELGWRRHYGENEVVRMFGGQAAFAVVACRRSGVALGELVRLAGFLAFRWLRPSRDRYRRAGILAERLERRELGWETRRGFWLTMTLERRETTAP